MTALAGRARQISPRYLSQDQRIETNGELRQLVAEFPGPAVEPGADQPPATAAIPRRPGTWLYHESIYQPGSPLQRPSR